MAVVSFQFSPDVGRTAQDRVLARLRKMAGVRAAGRIDADATDDTFARMCFAEVADDHAQQVVLRELHEAPEVPNDTVGVESPRGPAV